MTLDLATARKLPGQLNRALPSRRALAHAAQQRRLRRNLAEAMASGELVLQYRPRLTLDTGRRTAVEALARWRDRQGSPLASAALGRIFEHAGGGELGGWMMRAACAEAASWRHGCAVSVAVSAAQLCGGSLLEQIAAALDESGLDPELLEVTLTEAALADLSVNTLLLLSAIRDLGVGVTLDRFGSGLVSLAVLHRLPLTAVKLDQSLVRAGLGEGPEVALVRTIIAAGHALDLVVAADGIATGEQLAALRENGCDEGQGTVFGHPLTNADMRASPAEPGDASGAASPGCA